jgi:hypothetical protein
VLKGNNDALKQLTESPWFGIGKDSAREYACRKDWLFRRVESIEFLGKRSVMRSVSVDFEIPPRLPSLGKRAAKGTVLVPISVFQKWPPLMRFSLVGPDGHPSSLYLRTTNKQLDFGLLLGIAELALGSAARRDRALLSRIVEIPQSCLRLCRRRHNRKQKWGVLRERAHLPRDLQEALALVIATDQPASGDVETATNLLEGELLKKLEGELRRERSIGGSEIAGQIAATVDLAAQLAASSILWVPVAGSRGTDRIVKFSYLDQYATSQVRSHNGRKRLLTADGVFVEGTLSFHSPATCGTPHALSPRCEGTSRGCRAEIRSSDRVPFLRR